MKLRLFVSSTMEDLQNERWAVVQRLETLGFEAVHAETMSPTGKTSWDMIEQRMKECHVFLLILGESYGFEPPAGYGAAEEKSVTHLEFDCAKKLGLPVLPFLKRLSYKTRKDARRDALWSEVSDWDSGQSRQEFNLANDLADGVAKAIVGLLTDNMLAQRVHDRDQLMASQTAVAPVPSATQTFGPSNDKWVLVAGAGLSIAAGYPTAPVLMSAMGLKLWPRIDSQALVSRHSFSALATFYERRLGRESLVDLVRQLIITPQRIAPTAAHLNAVTKFKTIVTTNFDTLFEMACMEQNIPHYVVTPSTTQVSAASGSVAIHKLSGTIADPGSLLLTLKDLDRAVSNDLLFGVVQTLLTTRGVVVIGHSLRDEHIQALLTNRSRDCDGLYVNPFLDPVDEITLEAFQLKGIKETADSFLSRFEGNERGF
jgi:hypothetical protein